MHIYTYKVLNMRTHKAENFSSIIHYETGCFVSTDGGEFYKIIEEA